MNSKTIRADLQPFIGLLLVLAAAFAFSTKAVMIKIAYGYGAHITPIILISLRMLMSLPFFLLAIFILERNNNHAPLSRRDIAHLFGLGVVGFYLAAYLDFLGLSYISASLERLILLLYPTLVVLLSALFLGRAITGKEIVALAISYLGIIIVFAKELTLAGANVVLGAALIFGSATAFAIYLTGSGMMVKRLGATRFTAYAMTIACLATIFHFGLDFDAGIISLPLEVYGLALLMAMIATVIPAFLMNAGIQRIGASPAAIISTTGPVMTLFLTYLLLDEQLTPIQLSGAALVMAGVFVVSNAGKPTSSATR